MRLQANRAAAGTLGAACIVVLAVLGQAGPAAAAPPDPQATEVLVGGVSTLPNGQVTCPPSPQTATTNAFQGGTVSATCNDTIAVATAQNVTIGTTTFLVAQSVCDTTANPNDQGSVTVSNTGGTPAGPFTTLAHNVAYTGPDGTTFVLNEVSVVGPNVVRTAIHVTSGPLAGTFIAQTVCAGVYPLAVGAPAAGGPSADLAALPSDSKGASHTALWLVGGIGLVLLAQVGIGHAMWRRRAAGDAAG
jgi:hypothetical protein